MRGVRANELVVLPVVSAIGFVVGYLGGNDRSGNGGVVAVL